MAPLHAPNTPGDQSVSREKPSSEIGLTPRALILSVLLAVLSGFWVRQAEIVVLSTQITESIPAIPGLASLVILLPLNALLRKFTRIKPLSRAEILVTFLFVTVSSTVMGIGVTQFLFSLLTVPFYFKTNDIPSIRPFIPKWMVPHDLEVIRHFYERSPNGRVPWELWWQPALVWLGFFLALWWTMYCLMALFYRAWAEDERLSFPLVALPLEMTGGDASAAPFFRNKLMWTGFALAAIYNLINILHAFHPAFPAFGKEIDLSPLFTAAPWKEVAPFRIELRPELIGLGYLVSTEVSLTVWLSYFLFKAAAVLGASQGYPPGKLPFGEEQGIGAYITLALVLTWLSRKNLQKQWQSAFQGRDSAGPEGMRSRWVFLGLFGGFSLVWMFMTVAGMAAWVSFIYLAMILSVAMVYGRLRAEAGVPLIWLFPYYMQKDALLYLFGTGPFVASGASTMPVWGLFTFLARGYFPALTGYQVEGLEMARRARFNPRSVVIALVTAVGFGVIIGWYNHLTPYYHFGAQNLRGGIWGTWLSQPEYALAAHARSSPRPPDYSRIYASAFGALSVVIMSQLRLRFAGFPFNPLGYVMTCSYGSLIWASFLIVWIVKSLVLRYGGIGLYRKTVPLFLGFALGHFAIAGILWGLMGAWSGDAVQGYPVFFGFFNFAP